MRKLWSQPLPPSLGTTKRSPTSPPAEPTSHESIRPRRFDLVADLVFLAVLLLSLAGSAVAVYQNLMHWRGY